MLRIETRDSQTQFRPGEEIIGTVSWLLDESPEAIELRLFWYTQGKGTQDISLIESIRFDHPAQQERRPFRIRLPEAPYSFSGKLISLVWALELVELPSKDVERLDITLSPTGAEIVLLKEAQSEL